MGVENYLLRDMKTRVGIASTLAALVVLSSSVAWATSTRRYVTVDVSQSYEVPITNPATGVTIPSVLLVRSVRLDTKSPDGSGVNAPQGQLYLSIKWSSGPVQRANNDPLWGTFYSGLTPIPASALTYVARSGNSYTAIRTNPVDQTNNPNADTDDGLVDAFVAIA